jgi:hypothetical protein
MATANDLKIKIPLTPSQKALFPSVIEKINSNTTMLMSRLSLKNDSLIASCFDLEDVVQTLAEVSSELELHRFKKQAQATLATLSERTSSLHLKKNYQAALVTIAQINH